MLRVRGRLSSIASINSLLQRVSVRELFKTSANPQAHSTFTTSTSSITPANTPPRLSDLSSSSSALSRSHIYLPSRPFSHSSSSRSLPDHQRSIEEKEEEEAMEGSAMDQSATPTQAAPWARLKAWIAEKEAWEIENGQPAALTTRELTAISNLIPMVDEPDVSDKDYVSKLMHVIQSRGLARPIFVDHDPVNIFINSIAQPRWRTSVQMGFSDVKSFPCEGYGIEPGGSPPIFQAKKNSKQYAAKWALEYLLSQHAPRLQRSHRPLDLYQSPEQVKRARIESATATASPQGTNAASAATSPEQPPSQGTVYERITRLCNRLGLESPTYAIEQHPEHPSVFRGRANFRPGSRNVPDDLGAVAGVLGKFEAKLAVAEKVLAWLEEEERTRMKTLQKLVGSGLAVGGGQAGGKQ